jgi:hypothetical protein
MRTLLAILISLSLTLLGLRNILQEDTSDLQRFAQGYDSFENGTLIELGSAFFFDILSLEPLDSILSTFKLIFLEIFAIFLVSRRKGRELWADLLILTVLFPYIFCINLKYIGVLFVMILFSNHKRIKYLSFVSVFFHASMAIPLSLYFFKRSTWVYKIILFILLLVISALLAFYFERYITYFIFDQKFPIGLLIWGYTIIYFFNILFRGYTTSKIIVLISIILLPFFITLAGRIMLLALLFSLFETKNKKQVQLSYTTFFHLAYFFSYGIYQYIFMTGIL